MGECDTSGTFSPHTSRPQGHCRAHPQSQYQTGNRRQQSESKSVRSMNKADTKMSCPGVKSHELGDGCLKLDLEVKVRRQDSTTHRVLMLEEFARFVKRNFPEYERSFLKFPESFHYDKDPSKSVQGLLSLSKDHPDIQDNNWKTKVHGNLGEEIVYNALEMAFCSKAPCVMFHGLEVIKLFAVAKESLKQETRARRLAEPNLLDVSISEGEMALARMRGVDLTKIEDDLQAFLEAIFCDNQDLDLDFLSSNCNWSLAAEENQKVFKGLFYKLKASLEKCKRAVKLDETRDHLKRHLIMDCLKANQEFDFLLAQKSTSTVFHFETKSYPHKGKIDPKGLRKAWTDGRKQLKAGDTFFEEVLQPVAKLSSTWKKLNLLCFPEIPNRDTFKGNVDTEELKLILTREELETNTWLNELNLEENPSQDAEYLQLISLLIGSEHLSFENQVFDYSEDRRSITTRIVGQIHEGEIVGLPGRVPPNVDQDGIRFEDLKGKGLGHISSILFWNKDQRELLRSKESLIICGDYGGGKTSILVAAAREQSISPSVEVFFIPATAFEQFYRDNNFKGQEYVLDQALEERFRDSNVKIATIEMMRRTLGERQVASQIDSYGREQDSYHHLLREFVQKVGGKNVKFYIDEFPLKNADRDNIFQSSRNQNTSGAASGPSDFVSTLQSVFQNSAQSLVALKTASLLDVVMKTDTSQLEFNIVPKNLREHIEKHTAFKFCLLSHRMRNCSALSSTPITAAEGGKQTAHDFRPMGMVPESSASTVPGQKPSCIITPTLGEGALTNFNAIQRCTCKALAEVLHIAPSTEMKEHVVVLCGELIPPRWVAEDLRNAGYDKCTFMYDAGVDTFCRSKPDVYLTTIDQQKKDLSRWMSSEGGLLVTHNELYAGIT